MSQLEIRNLVLAGGSVSGVAYVGAIAALEYQKLLGSIKKVGGLSTGGALTALFLALGLSIDELIENLVKRDLASLLDNPEQLGNRGSSSGKSKASGSGCFGCCKSSKPSSGTDSEISAANGSSNLLEDLETNFAVSSGAKLHKWLAHLIEKSTLRPNCTFAELHEFVIGKRNVNLLRRGAVFRDLTLVAYNLNAKYSFVFSHESSPDAIIVDAVRACLSVPYLLGPWQYFIKDQTRADRRVAPGFENMWWVDGGLAQLYPIGLFDSETVPKATTLGLRLATNEDGSGGGGGQYEDGDGETGGADHDPANSKAKKIPLISTAWDYNMAILGSGLYTYDGQGSQELLNTGDLKRTIQIPHLNINPLQLHLTNKEKNRLIKSGWNAIMGRLLNVGGDGGVGGGGSPLIPACTVPALKE